jgi:hypothetical protein
MGCGGMDCVRLMPHTARLNIVSATISRLILPNGDSSQPKILFIMDAPAEYCVRKRTKKLIHNGNLLMQIQEIMAEAISRFVTHDL